VSPVNRPFDRLFIQTCTIERQIDEKDKYGEVGGAWDREETEVECSLIEMMEKTMATADASGLVITDYHLILKPTARIAENDRITTIIDKGDETGATLDQRNFVVKSVVDRPVPGVEHKLLSLELAS